jgi:two-component system, chemotaxis family, sensor kinase CheA
MKFNKVYYYLAFVFYISAAFLYVANSYLDSKSTLLKEIDTNLTNGAKSVPIVLPSNFHHSGMSKGDISPEKDMENIKKLSEQAKLFSLEYIYSCIKVDNKIIFTSSSATDEELAKNEKLSHYFDVYDDAKELFYAAFAGEKAVFEETRDKWGYFRSVSIPYKVADGLVYVACADVKIDFVEQELHRVLMKSVSEMLFYVVILIPLFIAYRKHNKTINEELEKKVKERTRQVKALLDNAEQGFLSFSKDMAVHGEYSKECVRIFGQEILGERISELLFDSNEGQKEAFESVLVSLVGDEDRLRVENILSLLQKEFEINKKIVSIEYKMLDTDTFMLILTDITEKKMLEKNLQKEKNILKMVVSAVSNPTEFFEIIDDYERFMFERLTLIDDTKTPLRNISELYRVVHTFKGVFSQKDFITTPAGLHKLESRLSKFMKDSATTNEDLTRVLQKVELEAWLKKDLDILVDILGKDFFDKNDKIVINSKTLEELEQKIKLTVQKSGVEEGSFDGIIFELEKLRQRPLIGLLSSYPKLVGQLSVRLEKSIYPLEIICGKDIYLDDICKPFIKSLVHVFRNSVDHGLETQEDRVLAGKDEVGTLSCAVALDNDFLQITIADDGRGIDVKQIAAKAIEKGVCRKEQIEFMKEEEIIALIFEDGFSTKNEVSEISGRGVGLASVGHELQKLGGHFKVSTLLGNGTTFTFYIPKANVRCD